MELSSQSEMQSGRKWLLVGTACGFLAVAFGAFGAHGIEQLIPSLYSADDLPVAEDPLENGEQTSGQTLPDANQQAMELRLLYAKKLKTWITGVRYHFYHALALIAVGLIQVVSRRPSGWIRCSGWLFVCGIIGFSGSIYVLVLTKIGIFGATAAIGGTLQLAGWACLFVGICRDPFRDPDDGGRSSASASFS